MTAVTVVLLLNNAPASADVVNAIQEVHVETSLDAAGSLRLRLGTRQSPSGDWPLLEADLFSPATSIKVGVSLGTNPLPTFLFAGYVASQSVVYGDDPGSSSVEIGALDATALMNLEDRTVAWPNLPDALIATRIFANYTLIPVVGGGGPVLIDPEGTTVQRGTDVRFLRRLARRNGFELYVLPQPNTGLEMAYFQAVDGSGSPVATLPVRAGDSTAVTKFRVTQDMFKPTTAVAGAVDARHSTQSTTVSSVTSTVGRTSALSRLTRQPVTRLGGTGLTSSADLQKAAQALVDRSSLALTAEGTVDATVGPLRPADVVTVAGAGAQYSGPWVVCRVAHRISPEGYQQHFTAARNAVGNTGLLAAVGWLMATESVLALEAFTDRFYGKYRGAIADVDDPLKSGRVKVTVPEVLADVTSGWALPCTPYAGTRTGLYAIPPVGAAVWVEFEAGDVSRPIWSGGWWGPTEAPGMPTSPLASPTRRELASESGLTVALDDDGKTITICDGTGRNLLEIKANEGQIEVKALTQVTLEAVSIKHGENATEPAVLGTQLVTYLNQLVTLFNVHMHPGELAAGAIPVTPMPPVAPFTPPPPSILSIKNTVE